MHICIDCRFHGHSGIGRYIREKVSALMKEHPENKYSIILDRENINDEFAGCLSGSNVSLIHCAARMYSLREQWQLPLRIPACDVFWAPHYNAPLLPVRAKEKWVTIHDMAHLAIADILGLSVLQKLYARLFFYHSAHCYDVIYTVSEFSKREIIRYENVPASRIIVHHNHVDTGRYHRIDDIFLQEQVRKKYQLSRRYILFVGNIKPHKNLHRLLEAYGMLQLEQPNSCKLVLAGQSEGLLTAATNLAELIEQYAIRDKVIFAGYVDEEDLPVLYSMAELFVFPSMYEGWGIPPLEALACGCRVLASDAASIPEACGDRVEYFHWQDTNELKEKLAGYIIQ